jgi:hypothetical protein
VCEREPLGSLSQLCDAGGYCMQLVWTYGQKRYLFVTSGAHATTAEARCERLGGTLVVLDSRDEREELWHELSSFPVPYTQIWVGLSPDGDGGWVWADGTPYGAPEAGPPPWAIGEPSDAGPVALFGINTRSVDNTLAHAYGPELELPFVCQFRVEPPTSDP